MAGIVERLQPLGRALMLPIAVLPVAALLLRLGQPDLLDIPFMAASGDAIFAHLGLLFAIGVAVGLARENHGAAGLAGAVCFLVITEGAKALLTVPADLAAPIGAEAMAAAQWKAASIAKLGVPAGIIAGLISGWLYNRTSDIRLPAWLAFFGGRRFVPIAAGFAGLLGALVFGLGFPILQTGLDSVSGAILDSGSFGLFVYGVLNRLLIVTGLHHILNNVAWFLIGDYGGATGDLKRFFAGDPTAGRFMSGFFPVMMFGLPAACLAMWRNAEPGQKRTAGGLLLSLGLTSFFTGVTEPIEFSFMFLAPGLYVLHALLTGASMVLMDWLGVRLGFGFSAGLFDYVLNFGLATKPLLLIPVGIFYFAVYYFAFSWAIRRFNLKTPGRDIAPVAEAGAHGTATSGALAAALGGAGNILVVDACTTRLRLRLENPALADEAALKALGARGVLKPGGQAVQVVFGPEADSIATDLRRHLARPAPATQGAIAPPAEASELSPDLRKALGGTANIRSIRASPGRLSVELANQGLADEIALAILYPRGHARVGEARLHLLTS